jgi:hypothetical protein
MYVCTNKFGGIKLSGKVSLGVRGEKVEYHCSREPLIQVSDGRRLKPDLVAKIRERVLVFDVRVRHEDGDMLDQAREEKLYKYGQILQLFEIRMDAEEGEILPTVIGTRGAMPSKIIDALKKLNITAKQVLISLSLTALRNTIDIYNNFIDYDIRSQRGNDNESCMASPNHSHKCVKSSHCQINNFFVIS